MPRGDNSDEYRVDPGLIGRSIESVNSSSGIDSNIVSLRVVFWNYPKLANSFLDQFPRVPYAGDVGAFSNHNTHV